MATAFSIEPLSRDLLDPAFDLATKVFAEDSTLHHALCINLSDYRDYLRAPFEAMVNEGLSLVAVDGAENVLGVMIATDFCGTGTSSEAPAPFAALTAITSALCRDYLAQNPRDPGDAILVDIGAVSPAARGLGIYKAMRNETHRLAKSKGYRFAMGELSSAATQRVVLDMMGHRKVGEILFETFEWNGVRPFKAIQDPPRLILSEGTLSP